MNQSAAHVINEIAAIGKFLDKVPADQKRAVTKRQVELLTQKVKSIKQLQEKGKLGDELRSAGLQR